MNPLPHTNSKTFLSRSNTLLRNSKLTHVLADSLQRDSKALMIVQVPVLTLLGNNHPLIPLNPSPL
jgi:hypothetical protein